MRTATKARKILHKHYSPHKRRSLLTKVNRASSHFTKNVEHYITKKPYSAMGIAIGVIMTAGVCVGFLIHRH